MSNPVPTSNVLAPITGQHISSFNAVLGFQQYQNTKCQSGLPGLPSADNSSAVLDAARWDLYLQAVQDDTTDTGHEGGQSIDLTCLPWRLVADIVWDVRFPPDLICKNGLVGVQDNFNSGFRFWAFLGDEANYPADMGAQYYFSPCAKMIVGVPKADPNDKKMMRCHIEIIGSSRIFKLPVELNQYNKYMTSLGTRAKAF